MIVGVDMFKKRGAMTVLGFTATTDKYFCKYVSFPKMQSEGTEIGPLFTAAITEALEAFKTDNNTYP